MRRIITHSCWPSILIAVVLLMLQQQALATRPLIKSHMITTKPGQRIDGVVFPAGTRVELRDGSNQVLLIQLNRDFRFDGHLLRKGASFDLQGNKHISTLMTSAGQRIDGMQFGAGAQLTFGAKGGLANAHIDHATRVGHFTYAENSWIAFGPGNHVSTGTLAEDQQYKGLKLAAGDIAFYSSGRIKHALLGDDSVWQGLHLRGRKGKARLSRKAFPHGEPYWHAYDAPVAFWPNGHLKQAELSEPSVVGGVHCAANNDIALFASGRLAGCEGESKPARIAYICSDGQWLYTFYYGTYRMRIDDPWGRNLENVAAPGQPPRYVGAGTEWRPPPADDETARGTLIEPVAGQAAPVTTTCVIGPDHGYW